VIEFQDVAHGYGGGRLLSEMSLSLAPGSFHFLTGPSGAGKSTFLKLCYGELSPVAGRVSLFGQNLAQMSRDDIARLRRRVGVVHQDCQFLTDLTAAENVALPLRTHTDLPAEVVRRLVEMKLHAVGLRAAADLYPRELSGGMARRVALARAMVLDPDLLLYDEPFSGLDPISMGMIMRLIKANNDILGVTSILVSHDVEEISQIADYCFVMSGGKVIGEGTPAELRRTDSPLIRQFMSGSADGPVPFHYPAPPYRDELLGGPR